MHIPDGFLSGEAALVGTLAAAGGLAVCARRVGREQRERDLPIAGLAAAFFLVGDAPMVPVTVGTQGHLLGGTLAVALLGPWLGAITIAVVCAIQALALGDGGITTLGLTIVNLALIPALVGYPLILALRRLLPDRPNSLPAACGLSAAISVVLAAVVFVCEFALGAVVSIDLRTLAASTVGAYLVIGVVEGAITALIVRGLLAVRPDLIRVSGRPRRRRRATALRARSVPRPEGPGT